MTNTPDLLLDAVKFKEHCLDFNIVVLAQMGDLALQLINLAVPLFLPLNKDDRVVESLLL